MTNSINYQNSEICSRCGANHHILKIKKCTEYKTHGERFYRIYFKNRNKKILHTSTCYHEWNEWGTVWTTTILGHDEVNTIISTDGTRMVNWPLVYDRNSFKFSQTHAACSDSKACPGDAIYTLVKIQKMWLNALKLKRRKRYQSFVFTMLKHRQLSYEMNDDVLMYIVSFV